jgi:hypothetical protein
MKISELKERIQIIYGQEKTNNDGDREIIWEKANWAWAAITPKNISSSEINMTNRYEVVMKKNYIRHTRHAFKIRIRWKHKLLEMISLAGKNA